MKKNNIQKPKSPIVRYDVTVGNYDDFPDFTCEQMERRVEVEKAAVNLFRTLSGDRKVFLNIDYDQVLNIIDLAADHLVEKGYTVYYPEIRTCIDSTTNKRTKYRCIQNYYNQYDFNYNEKGEPNDKS